MLQVLCYRTTSRGLTLCSCLGTKALHNELTLYHMKISLTITRDLQNHSKYRPVAVPGYY